MVTEAISKDKPFEVILVWKFSRFSRDRVDNAIYKNRLKKRGVRIVSIKEPTDDSPAGQFMEGVIEEVDAFYSANLSQEVRRGQRKVAERGYYPGNRAPYGYKLEKIREDDGNAFHNIFVKEPDTAPIVRRIFDEAIAGRTYTDIREGLNRDRVPPPEPKNKKDAKSKKWCDSTLYSVLHNLHHAGFIVWGVNSQSGDPPVVAKGRHEPIVSEDKFNLAGRVMVSKAREVTHPKQTASVYMLSRMLQCRHCGETLIVRPSKLQTSRYYQCRTRRHDGVEVCDCPNLNIQKLEERVLRVVLDEILCPSNVQVAISKMSEELTKPYEEKHAVLQAIESELAVLNGRQSRVMEAYEAGAYTVDDYSRRMAPLRATEADLQKKRAETARELDHQTAALAKPEEVLQFTSHLSDFLENSSPKDRKQMLNRFIKCIWIEPGKGTVVYRVPLPEDAKRPHATELVLALEEPVPPTVRVTPTRRGTTGHSVTALYELKFEDRAEGTASHRVCRRLAELPPGRSRSSSRGREDSPHGHMATEILPRGEPAIIHNIHYWLRKAQQENAHPHLQRFYQEIQDARGRPPRDPRISPLRQNRQPKKRGKRLHAQP